MKWISGQSSYRKTEEWDKNVKHGEKKKEKIRRAPRWRSRIYGESVYNILRNRNLYIYIHETVYKQSINYVIFIALWKAWEYYYSWNTLQ